MKRTLALFTSLLLLVSLLIPVAAAEENTIEFDSAYVNGAIYTIGASENATALRIFSFNPVTDFSEHTDIDEILTSGEKIYSLIAVTEDGRIFKFWQRTEKSPTYLTTHAYQPDSEAIDFYLNADLQEYLGSNTVVNHVYFLDGSTLGTAIYYRTNKGDYVYFNHDDISPCLFSAKAFSAYMDFVRVISFDSLRFDIWDLSSYELGSPFFNPNANRFPKLPDNFWFILSMSMLLLIAAVILIITLIYRKKVKDHNPYEDYKGTGFDPEFVIYHTINDHADTADNLPPTPN